MVDEKNGGFAALSYESGAAGTQRAKAKSLSRMDIQNIILEELGDRQAHPVAEIVARILQKDDDLYEGEVRSSLLALIRRNQVDLANDLRTIQLAQEEPQDAY